MMVPPGFEPGPRRMLREFLGGKKDNILSTRPTTRLRNLSFLVGRVSGIPLQVGSFLMQEVG